MIFRHTGQDLHHAADVFIHPHALVESDSIGRGTRIWAFAHVMQGAVVGRVAHGQREGEAERVRARREPREFRLEGMSDAVTA